MFDTPVTPLDIGIDYRVFSEEIFRGGSRIARELSGIKIARLHDRSPMNEGWPGIGTKSPVDHSWRNMELRS